MDLDKRETELPSRKDIIRICREVRRDVYRKKVEPWLKETIML